MAWCAGDFVVRTSQVSWDLPCGVFVVANREFRGPGAAACRQPVSTCVFAAAGGCARVDRPRGWGGASKIDCTKCSFRFRPQSVSFLLLLF